MKFSANPASSWTSDSHHTRVGTILCLFEVSTWAHYRSQMGNLEGPTRNWGRIGTKKLRGSQTEPNYNLYRARISLNALSLPTSVATSQQLFRWSFCFLVNPKSARLNRGTCMERMLSTDIQNVRTIFSESNMIHVGTTGRTITQLHACLLLPLERTIYSTLWSRHTQQEPAASIGCSHCEDHQQAFLK